MNANVPGVTQSSLLKCKKGPSFNISGIYVHSKRPTASLTACLVLCLQDAYMFHLMVRH